MKISKRTVSDLLVLIEHAKSDMSFESEGSYCLLDQKGERITDKTGIKKASRAIDFIKELIILG